MVSKKSKFYFFYINDLGPWSICDLDLEYSNAFIYLISCLHLQTSQAAIVSEQVVQRATIARLRAIRKL